MSIEGLAIIDDQASITLVDPCIINALDIQPSHLSKTSLSTTTVQGTSPAQPCHLVHGLVVTPLDGTTKISLPPAYAHNSLPNVLHEVPSRDTVAATHGLEHLAPHFHNHENWSTILLIGRDCAIAQRQDQVLMSSDEKKLASKTPLGWVLIGEHSDSPTPTETPPCQNSVLQTGTSSGTNQTWPRNTEKNKDQAEEN